MWVYLRVDVQPITTAWIYHNPELWLISLSSDGSTWLTIADKNLGATQVYNSWDTLSEANCGKFYQWGNNYWFPYTWATTTEATTVNAQNYWPWNYYSNSTFRKFSNWIWDSSNNTNLWWWVTWTNVAMQWPCGNWFHIPKSSELTNLINVWVSIWAWTTSWWSNTKSYIKLPFSWNLASTWWTLSWWWSFWWLWSSNKNWAWTAYAFIASAWTMSVNSSSVCTNGFSIRPFKNEAVQPDISRDVLYQQS